MLRVLPLRSLVCSFVLGLALVALGCGGGGVKVTGKLVKGGSPYQPKDGDQVTITIGSEDGKHNYSGEADSSGNFTLTGDKGAGVVDGKYKVTVIQYHKGAKAPPMPKQYPDLWDVSASSKDFTLDMAKLK